MANFIFAFSMCYNYRNLIFSSLRYNCTMNCAVNQITLVSASTQPQSQGIWWGVRCGSSTVRPCCFKDVQLSGCPCPSSSTSVAPMVAVGWPRNSCPDTGHLRNVAYTNFFWGLDVYLDVAGSGSCGPGEQRLYRAWGWQLTRVGSREQVEQEAGDKKGKLLSQHVLL